MCIFRFVNKIDFFSSYYRIDIDTSKQLNQKKKHIQTIEPNAFFRYSYIYIYIIIIIDFNKHFIYIRFIQIFIYSNIYLFIWNFHKLYKFMLKSFFSVCYHVCWYSHYCVCWYSLTRILGFYSVLFFFIFTFWLIFGFR